MKPLPNGYNKNSYTFRFFDRQGDVAIYEQIDPETNQRVAFEVFEVKKNERFFAWGKWHEAAESVPTNEEWGKLGYTVWTEGVARLRMAELLKRIEERNMAKANTQN